jgi:hypothetical protein
MKALSPQCARELSAGTKATTRTQRPLSLQGLWRAILVTRDLAKLCRSEGLYRANIGQ